ncbi:hypothetical protein Purlil1_13500 [Purpureocillium lilacinum]|uniref:Uncharacterized protein n=1 Tax=Purpureocillium lilacinum TaxID=33203 RepID=A0ABR0BDW2_PURLI|nr:hypothetical protein Purlil1_13500 [Purpureocillium lilacinum]
MSTYRPKFNMEDIGKQLERLRLRDYNSPLLPKPTENRRPHHRSTKTENDVEHDFEGDVVMSDSNSLHCPPEHRLTQEITSKTGLSRLTPHAKHGPGSIGKRKKAVKKKAMPQALAYGRLLVRPDATFWFLQTWQTTLAAWASLLHVTTLPPDCSVTCLNLSAAVRAIDTVMSGEMEPTLPRRFGFARFFRFLEALKNRVCDEKQKGFIGREDGVVNSSHAYRIYAAAQQTPTKANIRIARQKGKRFHQMSIESPLLLSVLSRSADKFADPSHADERTFTVLVFQAREEIPRKLRDVCQYLTAAVEEAITEGRPYADHLGQEMADHVRRYLA